jgi:hypothetical protein
LAGRHKNVKGFADSVELTGKGGKDLNFVPPAVSEALAALAAVGLNIATPAENSAGQPAAEGDDDPAT